MRADVRKYLIARWGKDAEGMEWRTREQVDSDVSFIDKTIASFKGVPNGHQGLRDIRDRDAVIRERYAVNATAES